MKKVVLGLTIVINLASANKFAIGDIAYMCAGTIFGERNMCKSEVLNTNGEEIQIQLLTKCTNIHHKDDVKWIQSENAATVKEVRKGFKCQW